MRLSDEQWMAIREAVERDDRRQFEELVTIAVSLREQARRRELAQARKHDEPAWLPTR